MVTFSPEALALFGVVGVHLVPKLLQRVRIPPPVTALGLGALANMLVPTLAHDATLGLLSTIGIAALFLFAGLEIDPEVLGARPALLVSGLVAHALAITAATLFGTFGLHLDLAPAMLLALGVATPSAGFIMDGLAGLKATPVERHGIRDTALVAELLALVIFFTVTQSESPFRFAISVFSLAILVALVPLVLRLLVRFVVPYAPNSEFPLLVLTAIIGAYATRKLDLYYLLGAFVVGMVARRLRIEAPTLASDKNLSAIELFAGFFAPFYFARAGMELDRATLSFAAIGLAAVLLVFAVPARIGIVGVSRHLSTGEPLRRSLRISAGMTPTFVFSLVMASVIADRHPQAAWVQGALYLFAVGTAFIPGAYLGRDPQTSEPESEPEPKAKSKPDPKPAEGEPAPEPEPKPVEAEPNATEPAVALVIVQTEVTAPPPEPAATTSDPLPPDAPHSLTPDSTDQALTERKPSEC